MKKAGKSKAFIWIVVVILCLVVSGVLIITRKEPIYSVESRAKKVEVAIKKHPDKIVGWIRVQGTNIDYPIVSNSYEKSYRQSKT